ncbi:MAG: NAD(P)H-hydrate dehydratase [Acidimicrobiales bacterium]
MIPVLTPQEMAGVDRRAGIPTAQLVERAGAALARAAGARLGGCYGRRVVVVAGAGNNGADGRSAAARLARRGARVSVVEASDLGPGQRLPAADLVVDAAFGTGLSRPYRPPDPGAAPVVAADIPSGLSGLTGLAPAGGSAMRAERTVTFAALKPGLLLGDGPALCGPLEVVDIGLGDLVGEVARAWLVADDDAARWVPPRRRDSHKWRSALQVVAGSPGMTGAPWMVCRAALRAGAGYVRLGMPGVDLAYAPLPPGELVTQALPAQGWAGDVGAGLDRFGAMVVGPGLGATAGSASGTGAGPGLGAAAGSGSGTGAGPVGQLLAAAQLPAVVDADGINCFAGVDDLAAVVARRRHPTVITPHEGEYRRLVGDRPGPDRLDAVRQLARRSGAVVLLKGSTTVVAAPDGRALLAASGSPALATAGTGDVLSGVLGAFLAQGVPPLEAAALAAHVHGRAAGRGLSHGLVATDLPDLVGRWLSEHLG